MNDILAQLRIDLAHSEAYLQSRITLRDWCGLADTATAIRLLEQKIALLDEILPDFDG